ncbi:MAG: hypothetical protein KF833_11670 [Verrucomicrobiae bacterium]|nr:hypothetical protein [Verrucomicrobiae bacterium]
MSVSPRRRRPWRRLCLGGAVAGVAIMLTAPWWVPPAVRAAAGVAGVTVGDARRLGWSRVEWREVRFEAAPVAVRIGTLEWHQPWSWLWRLVCGGAGSPTIEGRDWTLVITPDPEEDPAKEPGIQSVEGALGPVLPWLPRLAWLSGPVNLSGGRVEVAGHVFRIPGVRLGGEGLTAEVGYEGWEARLAVVPEGAEEAEGLGLKLEAEVRPHDLSVEARVGRTGRAEGAWDLALRVGDATNRVELAARFGVEGWLPESARLTGTLPAPPVPEGFPGTLSGSLEAEWRDGRGTLDLRAGGETRLPEVERGIPLTAELRATFGLDWMEVAALRVESEAVQVRLDRPVRMGFEPPVRIPEASLELVADAGALGMDGWRGRVRGRVDSLGSSLEGPRLTFAVQAEDAGRGTMAVESLSLNGALDWPRLRIDAFEVRPGGDARLTVEGAADLEERVLEGVRLRYSGRIPEYAGAGTSALPPIDVEATASGPFDRPVGRVDGRLLEALGLPGLAPLDLRVGVTVRGLEEADVEATITSGTGRIDLTGTVWVEAGSGAEPAREVRMRVGTWEMRTGDRVDLALERDFEVALRWTDAGGDGLHAVAIGPARWRGDAGTIGISGEVAWPDRGRAELGLESFSAGFLETWWPAAPEGLGAFRAAGVEGRIGWEGGPLEGGVAFDVSGPLPELGTTGFSGRVRLGADGVRIGDVRVPRDGVESIGANVVLPLRIRVTDGEVGWEPIPEGAIEGTVELPAGAWPWDWASALAGVALERPEVRLELGGTMEEPEVRLAARVAGASWRGAETNGVAVEVREIELAARATPREAVIERLSLRYEGQEALASVRLPLVGGASSNLWMGVRPADWREAVGHLSVGRADLGPLTAPWREFLQPVGTLGADLRIEQGGWRGWVEVAEAAMQPREPLGTLRDITVRLALDGQTVRFERSGAMLNGQPIAISGGLTVADLESWTAEVRVAATNLTLVRSTDAMLRADLDLALVRTNTEAPPRIDGVVTLRNSVVMLDVRNFVGVNLERPDQRPPYFSVDADPVGDWNLNVAVRGNRFARVLSPAFRGTVSAETRLLGTLRHPRLLGEGAVDTGQILFPFGRLRVEQLRVRFTEGSPYRPRIEGTAEGLNFGYSVTMSLDGDLDDPEIRLSTVPPMSTRATLQMLTAGTLPRDEYAFTGSAKIQKVGAYLANDIVANLMGDPSEEPRLTLHSGERVTTSGQLTYGVEYRLTDRWALVGEYDRWSQLNAGVRWRLIDR